MYKRHLKGGGEATPVEQSEEMKIQTNGDTVNVVGVILPINEKTACFALKSTSGKKRRNAGTKTAIDE